VLVESSLWPVSGVRGSCGFRREEVLRSIPLLLVSDEGWHTVTRQAFCLSMKMSWLMICHGSIGIRSDCIGSFVDFDPYYVEVLQLLHISKTACLIPRQNSTSRAMRTFDSGPKWFAWVLSRIWACMDCSIITCAPLKIRPLSVVSLSL